MQEAAQASADKAAAKVLARAGRAWDRCAVKVVTKASRFIREQAREVAQIAARLMTPDERAKNLAAIQHALASWHSERRKMVEDRRNTFVRRAEAEQVAGVGRSAHAVPAEVAALATIMSAPVRRISITNTAAQ